MPWTDNGSGVGGAPWSRLGVPCIVHGETRLSRVRCSDRYEATSTPARDPQGARARALSGLQRRSGNRRHRLLCADARPSSRKFLLCVRACVRACIYACEKKRVKRAQTKDRFLLQPFKIKPHVRSMATRVAVRAPALRLFLFTKYSNVSHTLADEEKRL